MATRQTCEARVVIQAFPFTPMKPVTFNNTVLRDGHQSLAATRMTTEQMLPAAHLMRNCKCSENKRRCKSHFAKLACVRYPSLKHSAI